jgi:hypothetical protein
MPVGISIISSRYNDEHLLQVVEVLSKPLMDKGGWKLGQIKAKAQQHNSQVSNSHVAASYDSSSPQQRLEASKSADSPWEWLRSSLIPKALVDHI